jgi:hypothetical protein
VSRRARGPPAAFGAWRLGAFGAWGLVAGLSVWADWLVLPYVAVVGLSLVVGCGRELRSVAGLALAARSA